MKTRSRLKSSTGSGSPRTAKTTNSKSASLSKALTTQKPKPVSSTKSLLKLNQITRSCSVVLEKIQIPNVVTASTTTQKSVTSSKRPEPPKSVCSSTTSQSQKSNTSSKPAAPPKSISSSKTTKKSATSSKPPPKSVSSSTTLDTPKLVSILVKNHCLFCLSTKVGTSYTINSASRQETDGYELLRRYYGIKTAESLNDIFDAVVYTNKILLTAEFPAPLLCSNCVDKLRELDEMHYKLEAIQQEILHNIRSTCKIIKTNSTKSSKRSSSFPFQKEMKVSEQRQQFESDVLIRCDNDKGNSRAVINILDDFYQTLMDETQDSISVPLDHLGQISTYSPTPSISGESDEDIEDDCDYEEPMSLATCTSDNLADARESNERDIEDASSTYQEYTIRIKKIKIEEYDLDDEDIREISRHDGTEINQDAGQNAGNKDACIKTESESKTLECDTPTIKALPPTPSTIKTPVAKGPLVSETLSKSNVVLKPSNAVQTTTTTAQIPSAEVRMPVTTVQAPSKPTILQTTSATIANQQQTPPKAGLTPSVTAQTPPKAGLTPSVTAQTPPKAGLTPSVTAQTPPKAGLTPSVTAQTPPKAGLTPSVTVQTPPKAGLTPSVTVQTPPKAGLTPSVTVQTPPKAGLTPSVTVQTPVATVETNCKSNAAQTPSNNAEQTPSKTVLQASATVQTPVTSVVAISKSNAVQTTSGIPQTMKQSSSLAPTPETLTVLKGSKSYQIVVQRGNSGINISVPKESDNKAGKDNNNTTCVKSDSAKPNLKRKISESDGSKTGNGSGGSPAKSVAVIKSPSNSNEFDDDADPGSPHVVETNSNDFHAGVAEKSKACGEKDDNIISMSTVSKGSSSSKDSDSDSSSESESGSGSGSSSSSDSEDSSSDDSSSEEEAKKTTDKPKTRIPRPRDVGFIGPRNAPSKFWVRKSGLPKPFKCSECDYECCNLLRFRTHMMKFHEIEIKPKFRRRKYICDICSYSKEGQRIAKFLLHLQSHETPTKSRTCEDCERKFTTKQMYQLHLCGRTGLTKDEPTPSVLEKQNELVCRFCTLLCRGIKALIDHTRNEHPGNAPFICNICEEGFRIKDNLLIHKIAKHDAVKLKCRICEPAAEFLNPHELFEHVNMKHHGLSLQCSFCSKHFIDKNKLRDHETMHSGSKNYICSECGNAYKTIRTLRTHTQTAHSEGTTQIKHICEYCSNAYSQRSYLRRHIKAKHTFSDS